MGETFPQLLLLTLAALAYLLPSWMLIGRSKRNKTAIVWLNILGGWTVVGWLVALVWALTDDDPPPAPTVAAESRRP